MRSMAFGIVAGVGLLTAILLGSAERVAATGPTPPSDGNAAADLIALSMPIGQQKQQVVLVDAHQRAMCVYHVDASSGDIELKSVRNFTWDAQLLDFNGHSPLPQAIRSLLEQKHRSLAEQR